MIIVTLIRMYKFTGSIATLVMNRSTGLAAG